MTAVDGSGPDTEQERARTDLQLTLRRLRRAAGLSQRAMAAPLHLAAHSAIVDFEAGRRIPAADILTAYEQFFQLTPGTLLALRQRALAERADDETRPAPSPAAGPDPRTPRQLPHDVDDFTGRGGYLEELHRMLGSGARHHM